MRPTSPPEEPVPHSAPGQGWTYSAPSQLNIPNRCFISRAWVDQLCAIAALHIKSWLQRCYSLCSRSGSDLLRANAIKHCKNGSYCRHSLCIRPREDLLRTIAANHGEFELKRIHSLEPGSWKVCFLQRIGLGF